MKRNRVAIFVIVIFGLALIGGGAGGMLLGRLVHRSAPPATASLTLEDLQLTAPQRAQIRRIWEGVKQTSDQSSQKAILLNQDRQDKLAALLDDRQKKQYAKIVQDYNDRASELGAQRQKSLQEAIEKTRRLLSEQQRQTYDAILNSRLGTAAGQSGSTAHAVWMSSSTDSTEVAGQSAQR